MNYLNLYILPDGNLITEDDEDYFDYGALSPNVEPFKKSTGYNCVKCHDFNAYAEPNQDDGSYKCYFCRKYG